MLPRPRKGLLGAQRRPDKTSTGEEGSRLFSSTFGPQEQLLQARDNSATRRTARVPTGPHGQQAGDRVHTVRGSCSLDPRQPGSTEEPVQGIPCLPGRPPPRFLSKRECPLEPRLPFFPLNPEQMGFMLGSPLRMQNFPPEARGHCVQKGVPVSLGAAPRGPPTERSWLSSRMRPWESKAPPHQGASELSAWRKCRQSSPQLLPRETLPLGDEWGSYSTCSPGSTNRFQTQEGAAKDSRSPRATLDKLDLHPRGSQCWSHKRMRLTLRPAAT